MSSRIDSPFGNLGSRVEATRASDAGGPVVRTLGRGRWVEFRADDGWTPGLQLSWEKDAGGAWWGRVVIVEQGVAVEVLSSAARLRPAGAGGAGSAERV